MTQGIRKYPRITVTFPVECTVGDRKFHAKAATLGGGGLFLKLTHAFERGMELRLRFRPAKHLPMMDARARVCYQLPGHGIAVEFTEIADLHRKLLLRLIHHKTADKRVFPRAPLATQIHFQDSMILALSRDVSLGGMFIETREPLAAGSLVNLRFHLEEAGPVVVALAEVIYQVEKLGMGVHYIDISTADRKRIEEYVFKLQDIAPARPTADPGA